MSPDSIDLAAIFNLIYSFHGLSYRRGAHTLTENRAHYLLLREGFTKELPKSERISNIRVQSVRGIASSSMSSQASNIERVRRRSPNIEVQRTP